MLSLYCNDLSLIMICLTTIVSVLEITVSHWPFSDQFQHLARPNFLYTFNGAAFSNLKIYYFQKTANQFLILISSTLAYTGQFIKSNKEIFYNLLHYS